MAKRRRPQLTEQEAARLVADALSVGKRQAATNWKVSVRTVERHLAASLADPATAQLVAKKLEATDGEWRDVAVEFLRKGIAKLGALIDQAGTGQIRDVAGAVKIVGELQVVREALGVDKHGAAGDGGAPPPNTSEPTRLRAVG